MGVREDSVHDECVAAYESARRLVFDVYPHGVPPAGELSEQQRAALARLDAADEARRKLRQRSRETSRSG